MSLTIPIVVLILASVLVAPSGTGGVKSPAGPTAESGGCAATDPGGTGTVEPQAGNCAEPGRPTEAGPVRCNAGIAVEPTG